jgi:hypothetical protein
VPANLQLSYTLPITGAPAGCQYASLDRAEPKHFVFSKTHAENGRGHGFDTASTRLLVMLAGVYGFTDNHGRCRHVGGSATSQRKSGTRSITTPERGD